MIKEGTVQNLAAAMFATPPKELIANGGAMYSERQWYNYRQNYRSGKMSTDKIVSLLNDLGYKEVKPLILRKK